VGIDSDYCDNVSIVGYCGRFKAKEGATGTSYENCSIYTCKLRDKNKKEKKLYVPIGLPGCGKTRDRRKDSVVICRDDVRFMLLNYPQTNRDFYVDAESGSIGTETLEKLVDSTVKHVFQSLIINGWNVYLDSTNLIAERRAFYEDLAHYFNYEIHFIVYENDNTAIENNKNRERVVPKEVIERMIKERDPLTDREQKIAASIEIRGELFSFPSTSIAVDDYVSTLKSTEIPRAILSDVKKTDSIDALMVDAFLEIEKKICENPTCDKIVYGKSIYCCYGCRIMVEEL
jgi:predicted kinase